jgi:mannose-1-phosphate guanylyltransferase
MLRGAQERHAEWGIVLAGGEGVRLRPLVRALSGDERPKQFCRILDGRTLLETTWDRVKRVAAPDQTLTVLTRAHEHYYAPLLQWERRGPTLIQPDNRGTAAAILLALIRIAHQSPGGSVALFPSDHYVSDEHTFAAHVREALLGVRIRPELVVLLGIAPREPEVEYGWIEPGDPVAGWMPSAFHRVRRFWEKPPRDVAQSLLKAGGLWNTFVIVGRVATLLAMIRQAVPELWTLFERLRPRVNAWVEDAAVKELYARLPAVNFSSRVLATNPARLAVLPVTGVDWSDWGTPSRVLATLGRLGRPIPNQSDLVLNSA